MPPGGEITKVQTTFCTVTGTLKSHKLRGLLTFYDCEISVRESDNIVRNHLTLNSRGDKTLLEIRLYGRTHRSIIT